MDSFFLNSDFMLDHGDYAVKHSSYLHGVDSFKRNKLFRIRMKNSSLWAGVQKKSFGVEAQRDYLLC